MLKHVVMWNLRNPAERATEIAAIRAALEGLRGLIPGLLAIEVGGDIGYDKDARHVVLYAEFTDRAALEHYQTHPLHLDAKKVVGPRTLDRTAVDWQA